MTPEIASALLALIETAPDQFVAACQQIMPDDAEKLGTDIVDYLSTEAGTEEEDTEDPADPEEGEIA